MSTKRMYSIATTLIILILITLSNQVFAATASSVEQVTNMSVTVEDSTIEMEWAKSKNNLGQDATGYEIYINKGNGYTKIGTVNRLTAKITGFTLGKEYSVKVRAYTASGNSKVYGNYSEEIEFISGRNETILAELNKLELLKATVKETAATFTWNKSSQYESIPYEKGFEISMYIPELGYISRRTTDTSITIEGFPKGTYEATVRIYYINSDNGKTVYSLNSNIIKFNITQTTENIKLEDNNEDLIIDNDKLELKGTLLSSTRASLSWNKLTDAAGYEVYASTSGGTYRLLGRTTGTTVGISGIREGLSYEFKIRSYKTANGARIYGDYSNIVQIETVSSETVEKVTGVQSKVDGTSATFSWNKVTGATGYEINVYIPGLGYVKVGTTTGASRKVTGFTNKEDAYKVKIRAYKTSNGSNVYGDYSNEVSFKITGNTSGGGSSTGTGNTTTLTKVTGVQAKVDGSAATFSWNKVTGATGYEINVYIPGLGYVRVGTTTGTSRQVTGFTDTENTYKVKIRAYKTVNGSNVYGEYSNEVKFKVEDTTTVGKVTGVQAKIEGTSATFSWNKVTGATGYEINVWIPGLGYVRVGTTRGTSRQVTGFTDTENTYKVKIRAYKTVNGSNVYGEYSNEVNFKPTK